MKSVAVAGILLAGFSLFSAQADKMDKKIQDMGFLPLALPSAAFGPGQVFSAAKDGNGRISGNVVCTAQDYAGGPAIASSPAANSSALRNLQAGIDVTASLKSWLKANLNLSFVKKITFQITNVTVETISLGAIMAGVSSGQSDGCKSAILVMRKNNYGEYLRTVETALKADITYIVDTGSNAAASASIAPSEVTKQIAADLSGSFQASSDNTVTGKGLYIGVSLSPPDMVQVKP